MRAPHQEDAEKRKKPSSQAGTAVTACHVERYPEGHVEGVVGACGLEPQTSSV
jgi:hypothetical protein